MNKKEEQQLRQIIREMAQQEISEGKVGDWIKDKAQKAGAAIKKGAQKVKKGWETGRDNFYQANNSFHNGAKFASVAQNKTTSDPNSKANKVQLPEAELKELIKNSTMRVLKEWRCSFSGGPRKVFATATYWPSDREIFGEDEYAQIPELKDEYRVEFTGNGYSYSATREEPGYEGVDDVGVYYAEGIEAAIEKLAKTNPQLAQKLQDDFKNWCQEIIDDNDLEFEEDDRDD